ncbi:MAG: multidrug effflux MFS transporter [Rhizobiales bacterium]|nr:multidrug effflux MFS transporter [Hyphomicrobiales bacterium]
MPTGLFRLAAILGLLSAVGPFAIDMYLPALPTVAEDLDSSIASAQLTLTWYFIAFGAAQLIYGPMADQIGRKKPLYLGLAIFMLGSLGCVFAPTMDWLAAARFVQGAGAASLMVVPRAIVRDGYTGTEATRLMALIMLVISVSPMLAPLVGSGLIAVWDWRAIFVALCVAAAFSLLMTATMLPETLEKQNRVRVNACSLISGASILIKDPAFMSLTFIGGFGLASFFVFLASASFVYTGQFGLSPVEFSLAFAVNAVGFFAASQLAPNLGARFGIIKTISMASTGFLCCAVLLLALTLVGFGTLPVIIFLLFLGNGFLGLIFPTTMVLALEDHGEIAGLASSLGGTFQMVTGALMIVVVSPFFDGTATPMIAAITFCAVIAFALTRLVLLRLPQQD